MPFTPAHFGPAVFAKSLAPRHLSLTAFACTQVAIDVETLTRLLRHERPVHRFCHTLVGGSMVGLGVAAALGLVALTLRRLRAIGDREFALGLDARSEGSAEALLWGGFLGGTSHAVLDAMVHTDARPLWPWSDVNPWLCPPPVAPILCLLAGIVGLLIWWARARAYRRTSPTELG